MPEPETCENRVLARLAALIDADPASVTIESSMLNHPKWDSYAQLDVMLYLEAEKGIEINEENLILYAEARNFVRLFT